MAKFLCFFKSCKSCKTCSYKFIVRCLFFTYKKNKDQFIGHIGDVAEMVRIALTSSKQSPNLYYILRILKNEEVSRRINKTISLIK